MEMTAHEHRLYITTTRKMENALGDGWIDENIYRN
jgi:hypothetical protein